MHSLSTYYFQRHFDEIRIEQSESWGTCDYYFETNLDGEILRQIEVYENGKRLKYSEDNFEDEFGFLGDQPIDVLDFKEFAISKSDFEIQWQL